MKRRVLIILIAALLLAPWPVVYAFDRVNADTVQLDIQPAASGTEPQFKAYGNAVGSVNYGELFRIDTTGEESDRTYQLLITNVDDLASDYRFMNFKIGVYAQQAGTENWERLDTNGTVQFHDIYISIVDGGVSFTLPGGAKYKITIEHGCFNAYSVRAGSTISVPQFYLSAG